MSHVKYSTYHINHVEKMVYLIDHDDGMSITNDAEAVVQTTNELYPGYRIVYMDTMGNWDELVHNDGVFDRFAPFRTK